MIVTKAEFAKSKQHQPKISRRLTGGGGSGGGAALSVGAEMSAIIGGQSGAAGAGWQPWMRLFGYTERRARRSRPT